eukprot:1162146-Pelagomonas_calceolata.AAC.1
MLQTGILVVPLWDARHRQHVAGVGASAQDEADGSFGVKVPVHRQHRTIGLRAAVPKCNHTEAQRHSTHTRMHANVRAHTHTHTHTCLHASAHLCAAHTPMVSFSSADTRQCMPARSSAWLSSATGS